LIAENASQTITLIQVQNAFFAQATVLNAQTQLHVSFVMKSIILTVLFAKYALKI
jgi:hypothetical protein